LRARGLPDEQAPMPARRNPLPMHNPVATRAARCKRGRPEDRKAQRYPRRSGALGAAQEKPTAEAGRFDGCDHDDLGESADF
jgi:hypothetical protein